MADDLRDITFEGVFSVGPEGFCCAVLRDPETSRVMPVWISPVAAAALEARAAGYSPRRPGTHELLADALAETGPGVTDIVVTAASEGVFMATIVLDGGERLDARVSDALVLSLLVDARLSAEAEVLDQYAFFLPPEQAREYLHADFGPEAAGDGAAGPDSASGDAQADADFAEMMRELGVDESEFGADGPDTDGGTDTDTGSGSDPDSDSED
ncbi:hypothetical protein CFRA_06070 [Corynebacterium frankenforstense DSM 45800]|uniref:BFN domain-containing protein n=1 Tax=Corynebacterium frankenforstense DSM 45800 TaxID=1437875 RepID=A0A1L7CSR3_9CORY|nr:bifunctional nuclease family protein [Corynebacterium frankenforstense]APT88883.1 hypothetical protein CFRA_06070 [Corynebacterium frankenforstense DSM 45800]